MMTEEIAIEQYTQQTVDLVKRRLPEARERLRHALSESTNLIHVLVDVIVHYSLDTAVHIEDAVFEISFLFAHIYHHQTTSLDRIYARWCHAVVKQLVFEHLYPESGCYTFFVYYDPINMSSMFRCQRRSCFQKNVCICDRPLTYLGALISWIT